MSEKKKHEMEKKTIATKSELQKPRRANDNRETGNMHMRRERGEMFGGWQ